MAMPDIKFYQLNGTCANAAHALLKELQIPFTRVEMGRTPEGFAAADGSFDNAWYKANVHHMGYVPALVVDGKTLTENPAVLTYIASLKPERQMLGTTEWERAKVLEWLAWLSGTVHGGATAGILRPERFADDEDAKASIKKKGMEKFVASVELIDQKVGGAYALGDRVTVVDFFLHVIYRWSGNLKLERGKYPRFSAVARNVEKLQGVRDALVAEELPLQFPEEASM